MPCVSVVEDAEDHETSSGNVNGAGRYNMSTADNKQIVGRWFSEF